MAVLTVQQLTRAGITPTYAAAAGGGGSFPNDGQTFVQFKNTNAAARNVTIATQVTVDGKAVADDVINVPLTTGDVMVGPFPPGIYNDVNGRVQLTYDAVTNLTVAVVRLA